jgi:ABC-type nickel/cobalt efflux system permease component RcnA
MARRTHVCKWSILALFMLVWLSTTSQAAAHPAPSVIHDYILSLTPRTVKLEAYLRVSPQLVPEVYRQIDTDHDGMTSEAERQAWVRKHPATIGVAVDGKPVQLQVGLAPEISSEALLTSIDHPIVITLTGTFATPIEGKRRVQLTYGESYLAYDEYFVSVVGDVSGDTRPRNIARPSYPATMQIIYIMPPAGNPAPAAEGRLAPAPLKGAEAGALATQSAAPSGGAAATQVTQVTQGAAATQVAEVMQAAAATQVAQVAQAAPSQLAPIAGSSSASTTIGRLTRVLDMLRTWHGEVWNALVMLLLALGIGALHALTPGHGKAVVAAYLVGSRGRVRDAVLLGGVVTVTHTIGVVLLGVVLLLLSNFSLPRAFQPALELISGLLVVVLGAYLLVARWRQLRAGPGLASEQDEHTHDGVEFMTHSHGAGLMHSHTHTGRRHTHGAESASPRALISLGISGGLVPCPDALAILLLAVGVGQVALGLGLVASFSIGLASVLIAIGIVMVKMKAALGRGRAGRLAQNPVWTRWIPLASAAVVIVVGLVMTFSSLGAAWS